MPDDRPEHQRQSSWWIERQGGSGPRWRRAPSPIAVIVRLLVVAIVLVVIAGAVANHTAGRWERDGSGPRFGAVFILVGIVAIVVLVVRRIRRTVEPVAQVIEATSRVASGDYAVRVEPAGPPAVHEMVVAFNTMASRLESNAQQRRRLFSDIAHELRTPLSVIQGTVEAVIDGVYPADPGHLAPVVDHAKLMARLLDDLQTLATAEAGQLALHREPVDLGVLLDDAAQSFVPVAHRRGVTIRRSGLSTATVDVDPARMRQVVDNLVSNAIRYTSEGGVVILDIEPGPGAIRLTVSDTGRGMHQDEVGRMFERFQKSVDSGGTGLGLAIARSLVEAHGGMITAESAPSQGTRVTITLPNERDADQDRK